MSVTVSDYEPVRARLEALGYVVEPEEVTLLPDNLNTVENGGELLFRGETATVTKILRAAGIPTSRLKSPHPLEAFIHNRSHDLVLPIVFLGSELLKTSPDLITLAMSTLQNYVVDVFKGTGGTKSVKAEIVIEDRKRRQSRRVTYEGPVDGLKELNATVKAMTRK